MRYITITADLDTLQKSLEMKEKPVLKAACKRQGLRRQALWMRQAHDRLQGALAAEVED